MHSTSRPTVIISHSLPEDWISILNEQCNLISGPTDATELAPSLEDYLPEAVGLITLLTIPVTEILLQKAPKLRVVSNMAVGVDNIDVGACTRRRIPVGNTPGVLTESTADLTMALMLSIARKLPQASMDAHQGLWKTWSPAGWLGMDLNGSTLGIIGMGKIGKAVAHRAKAFGMNIIYTDPQAWEDPSVSRVNMDELLNQSDIVTLHTPLTHETRGLINKSTLSLMKTTAILVNAARGQLVDTSALIEALVEKRIAAAALDVTDPEPLPPTHPLYSLPNCLISPHIGSATQNTRHRMAELACENLLAGLEGRPLPHCVNPEVYSN
jgi:phosphoglycerate dehydrogenase-like enzyme